MSPSRKNRYSDCCGSLTLTTISAAQASFALGTMTPPACTYCSSLIPLPSPAPVSTFTEWPRLTNWRTPAGVIPTRYSRVLISFGTPMIMWSSLAPRGRLQRHPQKRRHLRGVTFFYLAQKRRGMQDGYFRRRARRVELGTVDRIEPHDGARRRKR